MDEILNYLRDNGTFYVATTEGTQPRVRPFGAVCQFEGKLYICTNNTKKCYAQMLENPKVEISASGKGTWLRLAAEVVPDHRREARVAMLQAYEGTLTHMYAPDDGIFEVLYLQNATATINTFGKEPHVITF